MIETTLAQLDGWYNGPPQGIDYPKLLSKLAILELCGWIEGEFDRLILAVEKGRLSDLGWVKQNVILRMFGFRYEKHWRKMLTQLVGEVFARRVESEMQFQFPGDLERLKSSLDELWKIRCSFAHADLAANIATQQQFHAPSWSIGKHLVIKKLLNQYEWVMFSVLKSI